MKYNAGKALLQNPLNIIKRVLHFISLVKFTIIAAFY